MPSPARPRRGTLYGIGVGPGRRALHDAARRRARALGRRRRLFRQARPRGQRAAHRGAAARCAATRELRLEYPVTDEIPASRPGLQRAPSPTSIAPAPTRSPPSCAQGRSVGLLAEGDPFFYGSFMHMWRRLESDVSGRGGARRHRHVGLLDARQRADHLGRRRAHRHARHAGGGRADRAPRRAPTPASS